MVYPNPENITNIMGMFEYANSVSGSVFGVGILVSLYLIIVMFLSGRGENFPDSAAVAGYITTITGIIIYLGGLIDPRPLFFIITIGVLSIVWAFISRS